MMLHGHAVDRGHVAIVAVLDHVTVDLLGREVRHVRSLEDAQDGAVAHWTPLR